MATSQCLPEVCNVPAPDLKPPDRSAATPRGVIIVTCRMLALRDIAPAIDLPKQAVTSDPCRLDPAVERLDRPR